jgi:hypothetical protein
MPESRQASRTRTVIGIGWCASAIAETSAIRSPLTSDYSSNWRLIGSGQSSSNRLDERPISLKSKLTGFDIERRLVRDDGQLVLDEGTERFGNEIEFPGKLLIGATQSVEPHAKPFVEFGGPAAVKPGTERIREDGGL